MTVLLSMCALARVRMTFRAAAPAPLIPAPISPIATASAAAAVIALIVAPSLAEIEIAPAPVSTLVAFAR